MKNRTTRVRFPFYLNVHKKLQILLVLVLVFSSFITSVIDVNTVNTSMVLSPTQVYMVTCNTWEAPAMRDADCTCNK